MSESFNKADNAFILGWAKKIKGVVQLGGKCTKCGNDDFFVLEFHHPNNNKENNLHDLKAYRWSLIEKELVKCVLLCNNCHAEEHYKNTRNGQMHAELLISCKLTKCGICDYRGVDSLTSLVFHHSDPSSKKFTINKALIRQLKVSVQELNDELSKCIVLCRNCHRKEHINKDKFERFKEAIFDRIESYKELRPEIDRKQIWDMYHNQGMRQKDIVGYFGCSKGTISDAIKKYAYKNGLELPNRTIVRATDKRIYVERDKVVHQKICPQCQSEFTTPKKNQKYCSKKCMGLSNRKVKHPTPEELQEMRKSMSYADIAKKYGVSRVAVYRWVNPK